MWSDALIAASKIQLQDWINELNNEIWMSIPLYRHPLVIEGK